jgi:predicted acetyltransferase
MNSNRSDNSGNLFVDISSLSELYLIVATSDNLFKINREQVKNEAIQGMADNKNLG